MLDKIDKYFAKCGYIYIYTYYVSIQVLYISLKSLSRMSLAECVYLKKSGGGNVIT